MTSQVRTIRHDDARTEEKRVGGFLMERGIPLIPPGQKAKKMLAVFLAMEVGKSFLHTKRVKPGNFKKYLDGRHYAVRKVAGGFRCWRLK